MSGANGCFTMRVPRILFVCLLAAARGPKSDADFWDGIPIVSQLKSLGQAIAGDAEGARRTQEKFVEIAPGVSQITSAVQAARGDHEQARQTQVKFLNNLYKQTEDAVEIYKKLGPNSCHDSWRTNTGEKYCGDGNFVNGIYCSYGSCDVLGANCGSCISKNTNWEPGDIVGCRKTKNFGEMTAAAYIHTFVYVGDDRIVEAVPYRVNSATMTSQLNDRDTDFCIVMNGMFYSRLSGYDFTKNKIEIARRAKSVVGQRWPYSLAFHNCQHFVSYVLTGNRGVPLPGLDVHQFGVDSDHEGYPDIN